MNLRKFLVFLNETLLDYKEKRRSSRFSSIMQILIVSTKKVCAEMNPSGREKKSSKAVEMMEGEAGLSFDWNNHLVDKWLPKE